MERYRARKTGEHVWAAHVWNRAMFFGWIVYWERWGADRVYMGALLIGDRTFRRIFERER